MFARLGLGLRVNQSSAHDMTDEGHWNEDAFHHLAILLAAVYRTGQFHGHCCRVEIDAFSIWRPAVACANIVSGAVLPVSCGAQLTRARQGMDGHT